jgi:hypothetical protein
MRTIHVLAFAGSLLIGCSSSSSTRTISGRVARGFPSTVTSVKVLQGTSVVASAPVAADGSFTMAVPLSSGLTMRFVGGGHTDLVMPRRSGGLQRTFMLGAGAPVQLGTLHYVGNSSTTPFTFHTDPATECDDDCHDTTGATCVDDEDGNDQCDGDDDGDGDGMHSGGDDFTGSGSGSGMTSGGDDSDGADDGDCVPEHDIDEGCGSGSGSGGTGSGGSGSGSGSGTGSGTV